MQVLTERMTGGGSTVVRKELSELLEGFHVSEGFARPGVEAAGDSGDVLGGMD
jgi:hypothetical protein